MPFGAADLAGAFELAGGLLLVDLFIGAFSLTASLGHANASRVSMTMRSRMPPPTISAGRAHGDDSSNHFSSCPFGGNGSGSAGFETSGGGCLSDLART